MRRCYRDSRAVLRRTGKVEGRGLWFGRLVAGSELVGEGKRCRIEIGSRERMVEEKYGRGFGVEIGRARQESEMSS